MKKLTVDSKVINSTVAYLIETPGRWVGTETGKMVTRWDEEMKFECECEDGSVWYTDNILEAVEWLYTDEDDSISLDMEDVEELIDKAERRGKREALEKVKNYHREKELFYHRKIFEDLDVPSNCKYYAAHKASRIQIDRLFKDENL